MGLLTIIKKQKQKDKEIRCLVIGLDNSGKSTIVNQLLPKEEQENKITPTIGFQIKTFQYKSQFNVNLWDVGGQSSLRPFWENYFNKTDVLLWCVDISLPIRFDESFKELKALVQKDEDRIGYDCQIIVVLNKIDLLFCDQELENNNTDNEAIKTTVSQVKQGIIDTFELSNITARTEDEMMRKNKIDFIECSAITGDGIEPLKKCIVSSVTR